MNLVVENQQLVVQLFDCMMQQMVKFYLMVKMFMVKNPELHLKKFNRKMQMIFQDPYASLNPRMKVADIIAEGIDIHGLGKKKRRTNGTCL